MKNVPSVIDGIEFSVNGEVKTTSREVAKYFNKRHADVLRAIRNIECSEEFRQRNYALAEFKDSQGKPRDEFYMNKKGFTFVVLGFTGKQASIFRESYIDAFDKMESYILAEIERQRSDDIAKLECRPMTKALKDTREEIGKETKPFHYSNEFNMIYRVVLGVTKKKWCQAHDIDKTDRFRDHMPAPMIEAIADMQRVNTDMIEMGIEYKERKMKLDKLYTKRHLQKCLDEIDNQEA